MGNLTKNQQKREKIAIDVKQEKQSTLEDLSFQFNINRTQEAITPTKAIVINKISDTNKEDELALKVELAYCHPRPRFQK